MLYASYEVVSADTRVINVPLSNVTGSRFEQVDGDAFTIEYPVQTGDLIPSICGSGDQSVSDGIGVRNRFTLVAKSVDAEQDGFLVADTALVHQIGLRWESCGP
jgi:hypothetical protein